MCVTIHASGYLIAAVTDIVPCPPQWLSPRLDDTERFPGRLGIPELDRGVMATRGQLVLDQVAPVKVVDTRHVSSDVA